MHSGPSFQLSAYCSSADSEILRHFNHSVHCATWPRSLFFSIVENFVIPSNLSILHTFLVNSFGSFAHVPRAESKACSKAKNITSLFF